MTIKERENRVSLHVEIRFQTSFQTHGKMPLDEKAIRAIKRAIKATVKDELEFIAIDVAEDPTITDQDTTTQMTHLECRVGYERLDKRGKLCCSYL